MADTRIIGSPLEVGGAITSVGVAVPTISSTSTLTNKTLTTPAVTLPSVTFTTATLTATGTGSADATAVPAAYPAFVTVTGATGSGVSLPTGPIGATYFVQNLFAGTMRFYCAGGTINGTTGTTAALITTTGTKVAWFFNTSASGAWIMAGNT
jgi:hypothetical protein